MSERNRSWSTTTSTSVTIGRHTTVAPDDADAEAMNTTTSTWGESLTTEFSESDAGFEGRPS